MKHVSDRSENVQRTYTSFRPSSHIYGAIGGNINTIEENIGTGDDL